MKLNFWQWLALVLLVIGLVIWMYERSHTTPTAPPPNQSTPPATQNVIAR